MCSGQWPVLSIYQENGTLIEHSELLLDLMAIKNISVAVHGQSKFTFEKKTNTV